MSHVLTSMLFVSLDDLSDENLAKLNAWAAGQMGVDDRPEAREVFKRINESFGGLYAAQVDCYASAANCLDRGDLVEFLRSLQWDDRAVVQLAWNCEHDEGVRLVTVRGEPNGDCCDRRTK